MNFHIMTLFPEMIENAMAVSITGRAVKAGHISVHAVNIRDYAANKHNRVDDYPYGGGAGMVMQAEPVYRCYLDIMAQCSENGIDKKIKVIYLSPQGKVFSQQMAQQYAEEDNLIFLCGHYEGIDERVLEEIVTDYVSIGDYVLTGGELPALVMMDTISRLVPGVLNNDMSAQTESFSEYLLEYPQYTRPEEWNGKSVPPVLLSGNHKLLAEWYREQSLIRTASRRPDLLEKASLSEEERAFVCSIAEGARNYN
ncbi:tRNA (guanosine(37)-N1)-methyltransferase TrmD [bacterium 1xD8-6]|nr:tRNA (guanosine(37)-N1)-methyltransferase TrmD [bacterium D16-36]RKI72593.1 tRNA (guanosine(37)-N1)-methyltransferase TrmD [bacterium 1xD8-6]